MVPAWPGQSEPEELRAGPSLCTWLVPTRD